MDLWQFLGNLHPKLVHFPLVLLLAGLLFDLVGLIARSERSHWAGKILTSAGTVFLLAAFICGVYAEVWAGRAGIPQGQIELHELFANIASWGFVILAAWRLFLGPSHRRSLVLYTFVGAAWYGLIVITAHLGGALVYDYGAAVTGATANTVLSLHDLNTLATRQTDKNLDYSEMMHHIFGYITLVLALSLIGQSMFPKQSHRLKAVGPMLLFLGGIFLFFCADLDLYSLTDLHQLRDREVQLHKTIAIIMAIVGFAGLRRSLSRGKVIVSTAATSPTTASIQAKMVAVMALIGGGMLFTHVHTVAPYANVAAGVYIAHITLGSVALMIGGTRLLADALPRGRKPLAVAFSALLCVEAMLLITYNEGLPWYIGYGRYTRTGPHGGTIAPFGAIRAELTYTNSSRLMDVYLLDRFTNAPARVRASQLDVVIQRGYQQTDVPVLADDETFDGATHFQAPAAFLKDTAAFCAKLALPIGPSAQPKTGYFDPWVTPAITPVPPNEIARYQCPMHEGIRATSTGICPLCAMPLIPITRGVRATLHDPAYAMNFTASPSAGTAHLLTFTPTHDGQLLRDLAIVHEHPLHLIVVSSDLLFFDHIHPISQPDGSLTIEYQFPKDGRYLLFADITPQRDRSQVFRFPVSIGVEHKEDDAPRLVASPALSRTLAQDPTITAELVPVPRILTAGTHAQLLFRLSRNGQPLTNLAPYLGAMGHCVIVSEDTQTFLHCHPEQLLTPLSTDRGGPDVVFHTHFPRVGRYKVWGQFNLEGTILVADFVVDVTEPILPAKWMSLLLDD